MSNPVDELAKYNVRPDAEHEKKSPKVEDIVDMSVAPLRADMDVIEATSFLAKKGMTGLAVVDEEKNIIGFFSTRASLKALYNEVYNQHPTASVGDYMSADTHPVDLQTPLSDLVEKMVDAYYHTYPVTKDGKYVGYVSLARVIKSLLKKS